MILLFYDEACVLVEFLSPFWTNIPDCITTVNLHNNHSEDPLTVHPILYLGNGEPIELKPIEMAPLASAQIEVNKVEAASSSLWVSGWRPAVGWVCVLGMAGNFMVIPFANFVLALLDIDVNIPLVPLDTMMPVLMGMLGLGAMRSFEKTKGVSR